MKKAFVMSLFCAAITAIADINPWQKNELQHLLNFVAASPCEFERNGDKVSGEDAADHMLKKYKHFADQIQTTEDFIRLAATKSEVSGKPYLVYCKGVPATPSADYLRAELGKYRVTANKLL